MVTRKPARVSNKVLAKAREVLAYAEKEATQSADRTAYFNALFSPGGKASQMFPTEEERTAFSKTKEYNQICVLVNRLPSPPVTGVVGPLSTDNSTISVTVPRSVHAALLAEANAEGVSLHQLCLSKLVRQLRAVV